MVHLPCLRCKDSASVPFDENLFLQYDMTFTMSRATRRSTEEIPLKIPIIVVKINKISKRCEYV